MFLIDLLKLILSNKILLIVTIILIIGLIALVLYGNPYYDKVTKANRICNMCHKLTENRN